MTPSIEDVASTIAEARAFTLALKVPEAKELISMIEIVCLALEADCAQVRAEGVGAQTTERLVVLCEYLRELWAKATAIEREQQKKRARNRAKTNKKTSIKKIRR